MINNMIIIINDNIEWCIWLLDNNMSVLMIWLIIIMNNNYDNN